MNRERACNILDIPIDNLVNIEESVIKKQYHMKALQYHPDKNKNTDAVVRFQEIRESYEYLLNQNKTTYKLETDEYEYSTILQTFLESIWKGESKNSLFSLIIEKITGSCETKVIELLEKLDNNILIKIHDVFSKYKSVFHFSEGFLKYVEQVLSNKIKNDECIILNPSIDDLFDCNLYKIKEKGYTYIVPLWHHELVYDNSGCDLYVRCNPILPENIYIDEDNDIHISVEYAIKDIFNEKTVEIAIGKHVFSIYVEQMYLKSKQTTILKGKGIPRVIVDDIYNVEKRSNLHIHVNLDV